MSKTIKQLADELGVSKQAVMYRIKKIEATKENGCLSTKENGVLVVSLAVESLVKEAFNGNDRQTFGDKQPTKENGVFGGEIIRILQDTITVLQGQLTIKDKQIEELTATVKNLSQSINADRHSELANKLIDGKPKLIEDGSTKPKRWERLMQLVKGV